MSDREQRSRARRQSKKVFETSTLKDIGKRCKGKMHDYKKGSSSQLNILRRRYVLGLEDEAP